MKSKSMSHLEEKRLKDRVHKWINRYYPRTGKCQNKECLGIPSRRTEYSLIHGKEYTREIDNYRELCVSCHKRYDITPERNKKVSDSNMGKSAYWNTIPIIGIKNNRKILYKSTREASTKLGIWNTAIANCLKGRSKTAGGFKWIYAN